jgi:predicted TIM-barrel fold metal-dependent hydrolase
MNRRQLMKTVPAAVAGISMKPAMGQSPKNSPKEGVLPLEQYEPKSMLHTVETHVPRSRFPLIDFHTHLTWSGELSGKDEVKLIEKPEELLPVMDRKNIHTMVDLTGGYANGLNDAIRLLQQAHPGRFIVFTEPWWSKIEDPNYPKFQADQIEAAHKAGAKGIKVLKILGLYLREHVKTGKLVAIDDRRFDPMWEAAGAMKMPVAMHISDPEAFFLPIDRFNERWEELHAHPDWSFHGKDFPSNMELQEARRRVMRRHPKTQFVCLHVADSENLAYVSECMDELPNMAVDIAARISELGRQPRASRKFFDK